MKVEPPDEKDDKKLYRQALLEVARPLAARKRLDFEHFLKHNPPFLSHDPSVEVRISW